MEETKEKELEHKRKLWVKWTNDKWYVTKAQGFYPTEKAFTEEELRKYLKDDESIDPHLEY